MLIKPGDTIEFIAPASKFNPLLLPQIEALTHAWGLKAHFSCTLSEHDWLCAATVHERFEQLQSALENPHSHAVWAICGGYGSAQLLPFLAQMKKPKNPKLLMGFSDITALHVFLNQVWNWPTVHAPSARQVALGKVCSNSIETLKEMLFGEMRRLKDAPIVGGNLSIVISLMGTPWQIQPEGKYLFFEETGEKAYRVDRIFHQLEQANIFEKIKGLILGDFVQKDTLTADEDTKKVLEMWKARLPCEVTYFDAGHGVKNFPIPLNF